MNIYLLDLSFISPLDRHSHGPDQHVDLELDSHLQRNSSQRFQSDVALVLFSCGMKRTICKLVDQKRVTVQEVGVRHVRRRVVFAAESEQLYQFGTAGFEILFITYVETLNSPLGTVFMSGSG